MVQSSHNSLGMINLEGAVMFGRKLEKEPISAAYLEKANESTL